MARRSAMRMHAVAPAQGMDRLLLLLAFAAGVIGGIMLKLLGVHPFLAAGYAALILIAYAALVYTATSLRLEPETIGDNCYYLGFLFTLSSLATTLYFIVETDAQSRADLIPGVISGFGVALSSTIVGVFLRVLMMQMRVDLVSREHETRQELNMASRQLRSELGRSLQQIKAFTVESLQHVREREAAFQRTTDELARDARQKMEAYAATIQTAIQASAREQTGAAVSGIREVVESASREMMEAVARSAADVRGEVEAVRIEKQHALTEISAFGEAMKDLRQHLNEHNGYLAEEARTAAQASAEALAAMLSASDARAAALRAITEQQNAAIRDSNQAGEQVTKSLTSLNDGVRREGEATETSLREIGVLVKRAADEALEDIRLAAGRARDMQETTGSFAEKKSTEDEQSRLRARAQNGDTGDFGSDFALTPQPPWRQVTG